MGMAFAATLTALVFGIAGCAGVPTARSYQGDWPALVVADWDDIDAAMSRSLSRTETSILSRTEVGSSGEIGSRVRFELLSVRDDELWIEIEARQKCPSEKGPAEMAITSGSLLPGSEPLQRAVVGEVSHHLERLAGVGVAPLD